MLQIQTQSDINVACPLVVTAIFDVNYGISRFFPPASSAASAASQDPLDHFT
jgi:hypothetical protein